MFQSKWKNPVHQTMPTYDCWKAMVRRCYAKGTIGWEYYGGRGIDVCERWRYDYDAFVEDMGLRPEGMTIERIDGEKGYSPENCRWATRREQSRNQRANRFLTHDGRTQVITDWAEELGISSNTIASRLAYGHPPEVVFSSVLLRTMEAPHGSISRYTNRKCRCDECRDAWKHYTRQRRAKFK